MGKVGLFIFILFLNLFFFRMLGNTGFVLLTMGLYVFLLFQVGGKDLFRNRQRLVSSTLILLLINSLLLILRASGFAVSILCLFQLTVIALFACLVKDNIPFFTSLYSLLYTPINCGLSYIQGGVKVIESFFEKEKEPESRKNKDKISHFIGTFKPYLTGIFISLPVILILIVLLSSADPIFSTFSNNIFDKISQFLNKLLSQDSWNNLFNRILFSLGFGIVFSPFIYFFRQKKEIPKIGYETGKSLVPQMLVVMLLVAVILGAFIIIQWPYVFARVAYETDLSRFGVATYSEYVKRGFTEFIITAVFLYSLIWLGLLVIRSKPKFIKGVFWLYCLQLIVIIEFVIILLSVFRRIYLYQAYHGWSLGRIYGGIFLVFVAVATITLLMRHLNKKITWVRIEVSLAVLLIFFIGIFNAENFLAAVHPPTVNKNIDYIYLSRLSADGYAGWKKAFGYAFEILDSSKYPTNREIDKEERRKIAYSGIIVYNISVNYARLIHRYGSLQNLRDYYLSVLSGEAKRRKIDSVKDQASYIPKTLAGLRSGKTDPYEVASKTHIPFFVPFIIFEESEKNRYLFYGNIADSLNYGGEIRFPKKPDLLDTLYIFNFSRRVTYEKMKTEIGIAIILSLQEQFHLLFDRISVQKDREYDWDISLVSPLL